MVAGDYKDCCLEVTSRVLVDKSKRVGGTWWCIHHQDYYYSEDVDNIGASPQHYEAWRHRQQSSSLHCGFSRILTRCPVSHLCHDKEAPKLCPRTQLNARYKNKSRQKLMEHQQCSGSKNSFLLESNVHIVLGHVATFIVWTQHANVFMSAADTNATRQIILPNIKGSHCLNEEERNEVKNPVVVQEGQYRDVPTPLF